jgi:hypothetical protein
LHLSDVEIALAAWEKVKTSVWNQMTRSLISKAPMLVPLPSKPAQSSNSSSSREVFALHFYIHQRVIGSEVLGKNQPGQSINGGRKS